MGFLDRELSDVSVFLIIVFNGFVTLFWNSNIWFYFALVSISIIICSKKPKNEQEVRTHRKRIKR